MAILAVLEGYGRAKKITRNRRIPKMGVGKATIRSNKIILHGLFDNTSNAKLDQFYGLGKFKRKPKPAPKPKPNALQNLKKEASLKREAAAKRMMYNMQLHGYDDPYKYLDGYLSGLGDFGKKKDPFKKISKSVSKSVKKTTKSVAKAVKPITKKVAPAMKKAGVTITKVAKKVKLPKQLKPLAKGLEKQHLKPVVQFDMGKAFVTNPMTQGIIKTVAGTKNYNKVVKFAEKVEKLPVLKQIADVRDKVNENMAKVQNGVWKTAEKRVFKPLAKNAYVKKIAAAVVSIYGGPMAGIGVEMIIDNYAKGHSIADWNYGKDTVRAGQMYAESKKDEYVNKVMDTVGENGGIVAEAIKDYSLEKIENIPPDILAAFPQQLAAAMAGLMQDPTIEAFNGFRAQLPESMQPAFDKFWEELQKVQDANVVATIQAAAPQVAEITALKEDLKTLETQAVAQIAPVVNEMQNLAADAANAKIDAGVTLPIAVSSGAISLPGVDVSSIANIATGLLPKISSLIPVAAPTKTEKQGDDSVILPPIVKTTGADKQNTGMIVGVAGIAVLAGLYFMSKKKR